MIAFGLCAVPSLSRVLSNPRCPITQRYRYLGLLTCWMYVYNYPADEDRELTWPTVSANAARDVGGRLAALTIWGMPASGGRYAAIAALTTFPATVLAFIFYEIFFTDSARGTFFVLPPRSRWRGADIVGTVIPSGTREYIQAHAAHAEHDTTSASSADVEKESR
jgi:hypothetical protein